MPPPSSIICIDQHSGYCMATSIHQLPASGQKRASWYYVPLDHSSAWINTVGCKATSHHQLPASGQKRALWYYMPYVACVHPHLSQGFGSPFKPRSTRDVLDLGRGSPPAGAVKPEPRLTCCLTGTLTIPSQSRHSAAPGCLGLVASCPDGTVGS